MMITDLSKFDLQLYSWYQYEMEEGGCVSAASYVDDVNKDPIILVSLVAPFFLFPGRGSHLSVRAPSPNRRSYEEHHAPRVALLLVRCRSECRPWDLSDGLFVLQGNGALAPDLCPRTMRRLSRRRS
jgi:hypothetical protein